MSKESKETGVYTLKGEYHNDLRQSQIPVPFENDVYLNTKKGILAEDGPIDAVRLIYNNTGCSIFLVIDRGTKNPAMPNTILAKLEKNKANLREGIQGSYEGSSVPYGIPLSNFSEMDDSDLSKLFDQRSNQHIGETVAMEIQPQESKKDGPRKDEGEERLGETDSPNSLAKNPAVHPVECTTEPTLVADPDKGFGYFKEPTGTHGDREIPNPGTGQTDIGLTADSN